MAEWEDAPPPSDDDAPEYLTGDHDEKLEALKRLQDGLKRRGVPPLGAEPEPPKPLTERLGVTRLCDLPEIRIKPEDRLWWDVVLVGHVTLLSGPPGIGKTTLCRNIVRAVAHGGEFLSHDGPAAGAGVLVIDYETSPYARRDAWGDIYGEEMSRVDTVHVSTVPAPLTVADATDVIDAATALGVRLIVVDTIARAFVVQDENSNAELGQVVAMLKRVADAGFAVVVIAHPPKGGGSMVRGAGAILGAIDIGVHFGRRSPLAEGEDPTPDTQTAYLLHCWKHRSGPESSMLVYRTEDRGFRAPDEQTLAERSTAEVVVESIIEEAGARGIKTGQVQAEAVKRRIPERSVERAMSKLADYDIIRRPRRGFWMHSKWCEA